MGQVFGDLMFFLTNPVWIREETLNLATSSAAAEFIFVLILRSLKIGMSEILIDWLIVFGKILF